MKYLLIVCFQILLFCSAFLNTASAQADASYFPGTDLGTAQPHQRTREPGSRLESARSISRPQIWWGLASRNQGCRREGEVHWKIPIKHTSIVHMEIHGKTTRHKTFRADLRPCRISRVRKGCGPVVPPAGDTSDEQLVWEQRPYRWITYPNVAGPAIGPR